MKIFNYQNKMNEKKENVSNTKTKAEYKFISKNKVDKNKNKIFISKYVSTIDIPYGKYVLK